ncbi:MAG: HEAT repeat domain-containing protein, partial [Candidatus Omnitrophica bacterium]|nr:HEAT repeat domain-containing protein [Candidatus Omnitrophota bacterium]
MFQQTGFAQVAGELNIAGYLSQLHNALPVDTFRPLHLRYLSYNPLENNFKLFIDKGSIKNPQTSEVENTTTQLMQYFFIGLSLPNDSFWVNLRPDSPDNIIDDWLAQTDVGKIMLESDLQLKKDTAKATSPETPEGKRYWDNLYKKTEELFGNENISIPTLTRPWIVPGEIIIRETTDSAYIYKATLKVMLEQDYLKDSATYNFSDPRLKALNEYSSQLIRELIIPKLTKEVNTSKRYASLRQAYYSLILAQWFKARFYGKGGLYSWLIDKKDLTNLTSQDNWSKQDYFKQYQKSFKDGEYNLKEPIQTPFGQSVRSYFSGGMQLGLKPQDFGQFGGQKLSSSPVTTLPAVSSPAALEHVNNKMLGITIAASPVIGEMGEIKFAVSPAAASSPAQKGGLTRRNFLPTLFVGGALARNNFAQRSVPTQPAQLPDLSKLPLEDLLKLLTNDDEALRTAVVTELGKRAVPEAVPPLIRVLDTDPSMAVRAEAARSLHALFWSVILPRQDYLEKATDALLRALSLSGEQAAVVRLAAAEALPTFATRRRVLELISALTQVLLYDLNADVRVAAAKGFNNTTLVGSLESWAELRQHIIPPLLKALSSDRSTEVRMWATASLARTWDNQALEGL